MKKLLRKTLFIGLIITCIFISCKDENEDLINLSQSEIKKQELKDYFKSKGIEITYKKPKNFKRNTKLKPLVFKDIKQLDNYLIAVNNETALSSRVYDFTIAGEDGEGTDGGDSYQPSFFRTKSRVGGLMSPVYLNITFTKIYCEPTNFNSWITGNSHTSYYDEITTYLSKGTPYGNNITPIYYGVIGTLTTEAKVAGLTVYNTVNASLSGTHSCK